MEVENGCIWKVTILLEIHPFFTSMILEGRVMYWLMSYLFLVFVVGLFLVSWAFFKLRWLGGRRHFQCALEGIEVPPRSEMTGMKIKNEASAKKFLNNTSWWWNHPLKNISFTIQALWHFVVNNGYNCSYPSSHNHGSQKWVYLQ